MSVRSLSARAWAGAVTRLDGLLTPDRLRVYPIVLMILWTVGVAASWFLIPGRAPLPDFLARWTAGRSLVLGEAASLYDPTWQAELQSRELGVSQLAWFVSPPYVAPMFAPLGALPYAGACVVWFGMSLAALVGSLRMLREMVPSTVTARWPAFVLITLSSYPVLELLASGQDSAMVLLTLVAGLRLLRADRQWSAGATLALGLVKPQIMFLVPVALLLRRQYAALFSFVAVGAAMTVGSAMLIGPGAWQTWLAVPSSPLYSEAVQLGQAWKTGSFPGWLLALAPPMAGGDWHVFAYAAGFILVAPAVPLLARSRTALLPAWGVALATSVLASPHGMVYDLVVAMPVIAVIMHRSWSDRTRVTLAALFLLLWLSLPLHVLAQRLEWPLSVLGSPWHTVAFLSLWLALLRALRQRRDTRDGDDFN